MKAKPEGRDSLKGDLDLELILPSELAPGASEAAEEALARFLAREAVRRYVASATMKQPPAVLEHRRGA